MEFETVRFDEDTSQLRVSWDNRRVRKDSFTFWFLLLFWIAWVPLTCAATMMIFISDSPVFFVIWCVFGWAGTIGIPATFVKRLWREWIEINADSISWGAIGPLARKKQSLPMSSIAEFSLGRYSNRYDHESAVSLNIYKRSNSLGHFPRHLLGYWLSKENKEVIFERVSDFVLKRSIPLKVTIYEGCQPPEREREGGRDFTR